MGELGRFVKVIEWLDQARWKDSDWWDGWKHESVRNLSADQKVLAHWVTYITDMQMPSKLVWRHGLPVFATIVKQYVDGAAQPTYSVTDLLKKNRAGFIPSRLMKTSSLPPLF